MLKKYFKNVGKKIVRCPSCKQQLRLPIRPGKTLRIRCSRCQVYFDVNFQSPLLNLFQWNKSLSWRSNLQSIYYRFKLLPTLAKWSTYLLLIFLILFSANYCVDIALREKQEPIIWDPTSTTI